MTTKAEKYQQIWHRFDNDREHLPTSAREAVIWAVAEGLIDVPKIDPFDVLAEEMAQALRGEYKTDSQGRRYRNNHAVRVTKNGVQHTLWAMMSYAPRTHMEKAFGQRREQIIGDCLQLKTDVDVYNDMKKDEPPIQLVLDFTDDVAERQHLANDNGKKAA